VQLSAHRKHAAAAAAVTARAVRRGVAGWRAYAHAIIKPQPLRLPSRCRVALYSRYALAATCGVKINDGEK